MNYNMSTWAGVTRYSCVDCSYDVLTNETSMIDHCKRFKHGIDKNGNLTTGDWIAQQLERGPRDKRLLLSQICWNTAEASAEAALALYNERLRLSALGNLAEVLSVDNGSGDGTVNRINQLVHRTSYPPICNDYNLGISKARNQVIDFALDYAHGLWDAILFTDGDIEVVPFSSYVMLKYLECHPRVGVIGAYSANYSDDRKKVAQRFLEIHEHRVRSDIKVAWTQYGLFRFEMFKQGLRFDESGPFGEPGWGFEDDDFCFQMIEEGWGNCYFGGMTYLHRNIRSSWPNLERAGLDPEAIFYKRKDYVIEKWRKRGLDHSILKALEGQKPPRRAVHAK